MRRMRTVTGPTDTMPELVDAAEVSRVCGPREADGYLRYVDYVRRLWRLRRADFIERNLDGPRDLLTANPHRALALYAVISYLDTVEGVWFPRGGMHAVPDAMAATAAKHGVELRFRPRTLHSGLSNVAFTGSGTQPGVGIPMVLISGRLAAARITG